MSEVWIVFWERWNYSDSEWGRIAVFSTQRRALNFVDRLESKVEEWRKVYKAGINYHESPACQAAREEAGEVFNTHFYGRELLELEIKVERLPYDDATRKIIG